MEIDAVHRRFSELTTQRREARQDISGMARFGHASFGTSSHGSTMFPNPYSIDCWARCLHGHFPAVLSDDFQI